jgi:hypothetical protein
MKVVFFISLFLISSCNKGNQNEGLSWLNLPDNEKFKVIEKQFRGFDKTMVEVGYRYNELYWAGEDQNWELALYHLDKIEHAINLGLVRRPKRKDSAEIIFPVLESLKSIAKSKDQPKFQEEFKVLQQTCRNCHQAEGVPFFKAGIPKTRLSPIGI